MNEMTITIPEMETFDEETERFHHVKETKIVILHSLVSISKWESKWKKPFIHQEQLPIDELRDYVRCMTLTQNVDPEIYKVIPIDILNDVVAYMNDQKTATWFSDTAKPNKKNGEIITSELVYYWMTAANIPKECEKWHFSRLMTLIKICAEKNKEPEKMKNNDIYKQNHALNAMRRAKMKSKG